jgi:ribosomal protein S18 acetylase RimI-like enzyme
MGRVKQIRRLDQNGTKDAYRRLQRGALRYATVDEETFRRIEAERPRLIVSEGEAVVAGVLHSAALDIQYAFPDRDAFARHFPSMLERLLPAVSLTEAPLGVRFRLTSRTERPYVEPVLRALGFELMREWLRMTLLELPAGVEARDDVAPGFLVRGARLEDAEAIAELDAIAFAASFLTAQAARELIEERHVVRLIEETATETAAGFLRLRAEGPTTGYVSDIAVHPEYQRRGLGEALMRWALGWFRQQGMRRATLTVNTDNAGAIALYRKLGFVDDEMGIDYRRPLDEEEVRQVLEKQRTVHIRVRRRLGR